MFEYIEKIKKKSPEAQSRFAFSFALIATAIIVSIWLSFLYFSYEEKPVAEQKVTNGSIEPSPIETIGSIFSEAKETIIYIDSQIDSFRQELEPK